MDNENALGEEEEHANGGDECRADEDVCRCTSAKRLGRANRETLTIVILADVSKGLEKKNERRQLGMRYKKPERRTLGPASVMAMLKTKWEVEAMPVLHKTLANRLGKRHEHAHSTSQRNRQDLNAIQPRRAVDARVYVTASVSSFQTPSPPPSSPNKEPNPTHNKSPYTYKSPRSQTPSRPCCPNP